MNVPGLLDRLQSFVELSELGPRPPDPRGVVMFSDTRKTIGPADQLLRMAQGIELILDRVLPGWRQLEEIDPSGRWQQHRRACIRAMAALEDADEIAEMLGEEGPTLAAGQLHPWVWDGARSLWQSGHFVEAVVAALKMVNAHAQAKSSRPDLSETDLFNQLFKLDAGKPGEARLRIVPDDGGDTFRSIHLGARGMAEGLFRGIRNPAAHTVATTPAVEQHALEQLAAVSVLARWVDDAEVVTAP